MTKIDIISGFLGAGKTTLIRKLLSGALKGQQVVLIENEFGEIGIDGGFLRDAGVEIREMNQGCICCSLVGDFGTALQEVIDTYTPDRIIIEPSGVGKLSDVIHAVEGVNGDVVINCATTVVDVTKCRMYMKNFGEFFKNQVQAASTIVLSRTDTPKATPAKIEEAIALLRAENPDATIITTPVEKLSSEKVLETMEGVKIDLSHVEEEHEHHHHHYDENGVCSCGHHHDEDHDHEHEHHHHDHDEHECSCGHHHDEDHDHEHEHHHHDHDEHECSCGHHHDEDHDHEHEHHHHDHDGHECSCGHDHDHDHHHHYDENGVCSCGHHHHHADEIFTSWGRETIFRKYEKAELEKILHALSEDESYGQVLRAKGMVEGTDGTWMYFDMVPGEEEIRQGQPEFTGRLCVIGAELAEDKLAELFGLA